MEFTTAQIKDFAINEETFEKGKQLMEENAIVSLDIDDFSNDKIILINATIKDEKQYFEVNMSVDKDDFLVRAHICNCPQHQQNFISCAHCVAVLLKVQSDQENKKLEETPIQTIQDPVAIRLMNEYEEQLVYTSLAMNLKNAVHLDSHEGR